jgi:hypothetical protein
MIDYETIVNREESSLTKEFEYIDEVFLFNRSKV